MRCWRVWGQCEKGGILSVVISFGSWPSNNGGRILSVPHGVGKYICSQGALIGHLLTLSVNDLRYSS